MAHRRLSGIVALGLAGLVATPADARSHSTRHARGGIAGAIGSSGGYGWPYWETIGPNGVPIIYTPPMMVLATRPVVLPPAAIGPAIPPPSAAGRGLDGPWPKPKLLSDALPKPSDTARAKQLTTFGDRLFRGGNTRRAAERYEQAIRTDPRIAAPHVGLMQLAIARGEYSEAARRLRQALDAEPDWLVNAPDVQALYGEPADFARSIARIESHLQARPGDRDAWFVLGAQWYLSGRTKQAADVFLRLSDRKADPALSAFLDAATPEKR